MQAFEYRQAKVNDLRVATEEDPTNPRRMITSVRLGDERLAPSDRFWNSLYSRYGFGGSFFKYFNHDEVFSRIASKESDSLRICIERDTKAGTGRLLAVSSPGKPLVRHDDLLGTLERYHAERITCVDGIIESTHTPRVNGSFAVCGDSFSDRFVMAVPIDGYGTPSIYLSLLRHICSNGAVGYSKVFRSSLALGRGEDDVTYAVVRALDGFGNDEGFAALRHRFESAGKSWASVGESQGLYRTLVRLIAHREVGSDGAALLDGRSTLVERFHQMTGDVSRLYGLANPDALSGKRQRTLPVHCRVYDLLNFASELATHHATPSGARSLQAWLGTLISGEYDLESSCESFGEFQDFFVERKLDNPTVPETPRITG